MVTWTKSKSQTINQLSHPSSPKQRDILKSIEIQLGYSSPEQPNEKMRQGKKQNKSQEKWTQKGDLFDSEVFSFMDCVIRPHYCERRTIWGRVGLEWRVGRVSTVPSHPGHKLLRSFILESPNCSWMYIVIPGGGFFFFFNSHLKFSTNQFLPVFSVWFPKNDATLVIMLKFQVNRFCYYRNWSDIMTACTLYSMAQLYNFEYLFNLAASYQLIWTIHLGMSDRQCTLCLMIQTFLWCYDNPQFIWQ